MFLPALLVVLLVGPAGGTQATLPTEDVATAPEAAFSVPVLLVPGWLDDEEELGILRERLIGAGWPEDGVATLQFVDPVGSNVEHSIEIARAVSELRERTGSGRVDVVAHSMGGLALRHYLLFLEGGDFARRVVFLGTPHRGTHAAHLAWGDGGSEMVPGSDFLNRLNERGTVPDGVRVKTIRTRLDLRILPMSSATLPGASDVEVCCPTHAGLINDGETFEVILDFLASG